MCFIVIFCETYKTKKPVNEDFTGFCYILLLYLAVREGFEPSVQFPVRQFSKLILSASQAPHHYFSVRSRSGVQI